MWCRIFIVVPVCFVRYVPLLYSIHTLGKNALPADGLRITLDTTNTADRSISGNHSQDGERVAPAAWHRNSTAMVTILAPHLPLQRLMFRGSSFLPIFLSSSATYFWS